MKSISDRWIVIGHHSSILLTDMETIITKYNRLVKDLQNSGKGIQQQKKLNASKDTTVRKLSFGMADFFMDETILI
jgi:hypothetical protein